MQPEGQGRSEPPKIAWGSDIFSRSGRDLKARSSARLNSHTSSESYSMCRFTLQCGTHVLLDFNELAETEVSLEAFQLGPQEAF
jgi:hypothetical protein